MAHDDIVTASERADSPTGALMPIGATAAPTGQWSSGPPLSVAVGPSTPSIMTFAHALRRHWVMAVGLGLLGSLITGPVVWFGYGERFTATSCLRVAMLQSAILTQDNQGGTDRERYEIYKSTQQQYLLNRFVLLASIRKPEVARLPCIKAHEGADPAAWLERQLSVSFPGRAEIMEVSVTRSDPKEATLLVNAVVDSYLTEVVNAERNANQQKLNELDRAFTSKETDIRDKMTELKQLAEKLGTDEKETLSLKQKLALEELTLYRQEDVDASSSTCGGRSASWRRSRRP